MKSGNSRTLMFGLALLPGWLALAATASPLQLVSTTGPEFAPAAGGAGDSFVPVMSKDGRYVLFASTAPNLVALGTNGSMPVLFPTPLNVFLRDRTEGSTVLVSVNLQGTGGGDGDSWPMGISTNGRYALFESTASNQVANDTNNQADVFMRDLLAGMTVLVSAATNGTFANDSSSSSVMTPDGRYVAFVSAADNLVSNDTNEIADVFVRDLVNNDTTLVSVGANRGLNPSDPAGSDAPVMTPDGRYIVFYSTAVNLTAGVQTKGDVYVRDRESATTIRASAGALSVLQSLVPITNAISFNHTVSDDGRFVAFETTASPQTSPGIILRYDIQSDHYDLIETNASVAYAGYPNIQNLAMTPDGRFVAYVSNGTNSSGEATSIHVWDAQDGTNTLASGNTNGSVAAGSSSDSPAIDDSGRFVAFLSSAPDLVTNELPGDFHLYLRDLQARKTTLVDADPNGVGSLIDPSAAPEMSADARFVAFESQDGGLVPYDRNLSYDVFVRDLASVTAELVSAHVPGLPSLTPNGSSSISASSLSSDARFIAFWSDADDLVVNDANGLRDIYLRDLLGTNLLVSIGMDGFAANGSSEAPAISADGRYVAFTSFADNLVNDDTNRAQDVFVRDLHSGTTTLVSLNAAQTGPGNKDSYLPTLSGSGQFVLFRSKAGDLRPGMSSGTENLFWRDLGGNVTHALTTNGVTTASMTPDGGLVAFVTGSTRGTFSSVLADRLYVWDAQSGSIVYSVFGIPGAFGPLAISPDGQRLIYATNNSTGPKQLVAVDRTVNTNWVISSQPAASNPGLRFTANGRYLAYVSSVGVPVYTNQVYLYDFETGTNLLVSQSYDGSAPGNNDSDSPDMSPDGRFVSYRSAASNLVPADDNGVPDIFLYDRLSGATTLISASRFGDTSADNRSLTPVFSPDGRTLVFSSWASDLHANDFNHNADVFACNLYSSDTIPAFTVTAVRYSGAGSGCWLSWPVASGKTYRVQAKNSLEDSVWQEFNAHITVVGNRAYVQDYAAGTTGRFYRIVASQN
jgi:Tol biopolymer transport system component